MRNLRRSLILAACLLGLGAAPAMAERRGVSIADLTSLRDIGGPYSELALSPDGNIAAVVERRADLAANDYNYVVIAIETSTGRAREIGDAGGFVLRSDGGRRSGVGILRRPQFSTDGRYVLYLREYDGAVEIWRAAVDGSNATTLVRADGDVRRFRVVGDQIVFETSTPRNALAADIDRSMRVSQSTIASAHRTR